MHKASRLTVLFLALTTLGAASAQAAEPIPIATLDRATPISAYGGRLAWSRYDPATGRYVLVTRANGVTADVPIAPRTVPFDVDLGPDAHRQVIAVYSRCKQELMPAGGFVPMIYDRGSGCDLYRYDFSTGIERRLATASSPVASEAWPTVWGHNIAFVRRYDAKPAFAYVYTRNLGASAPSRRLPVGPRNAVPGGEPTLSRAYNLDLHMFQLAFTWTFPGTGEGLETQIRVETIGLGRRQVLARQLNTGGLTARLLGWPVIVADRVQWAATCFGEGPCGADVGLRRRALADGRVERASVPGPPATGTSTSRIVAHTRDRSATYVLVDSEPGADCVGDPAVPGGTCQLVELKPLFH